MARMHAQHSAFRFATGVGSPGPTVSPDSPTTAPDCSTPSCFSEFAQVTVQGIGLVEMPKLQLGDKILTTSGYEAIYGFAHNDTSSQAQFLQIYTRVGSKPLEVSGDHLLFVVGTTHPVRASSIRIGDTLAGEEDELIVSKVRKVKRKGLYAPLTPSGTILVDGIAASCYVSLQPHSPGNVELKGGLSTWLSHHFIVHTWLSPIRIVCVGISANLCSSYDSDTGLAHFALAGFSCFDVFQRQSLLVQACLLLIFFSSFGTLRVLEYVVGAENAFWALLVGLVVGLTWRRRRASWNDGCKRKSFGTKEGTS